MIEKYADIHCHILPGVDDGSKDMSISQQMIDTAYRNGARIIIFTPHYEPERVKYQYDELEEKCELLNNYITEAGYDDLKLYLGNELLWEQGVTEHIKAERVHKVADTRYILVEFNIRISYGEMYEALRNLTNIRLRPIIAHVERYECLRKHMERIEEVMDLGVCLQMNGNSMVGGVFDNNAKWCRKLLKSQCIHFIGSDAHGMKNRTPDISNGLQWLDKHLPQEYVKLITWDNAVNMLKNKYIV